MTNNMKNLIENLNDNNQDYEFYPTTKEIVECIYDHLKEISLSRFDKKECLSVLDIGCGTENFRKFFNQKFNKENALIKEDYNKTGVFIGEYMVMEKSPILLNGLNKDTIVVGTNFWENTLIDKRADIVFCNPPYSEYVSFAQRIIDEANCKYIYLVIPQRWKENSELVKRFNNTVESNKNDVRDNNFVSKVIGTFDFLDAERQARAKVDVLFVNVNREKNSDILFNKWFDETFAMQEDSKEDEYEWKRGEKQRNNIEKQLVSGKGKAEQLVSLYEHEKQELFEHYKAITSLDSEILKEVGVNKESVKKSLKKRIEGIKSLYWKIVIDNTEEITNRLTKKTREQLFERFKPLQTLDFTLDNIYSLILFVIKNANAYFDIQLVDFFRTLSSEANCRAYKSNQRIGTDNWRYGRFCDKYDNYTLDYRIVCDDYCFNMNSSYYDVRFNSGKAYSAIQDICSIANNLGFTVGRKDVPLSFGAKNYIYLAENNENAKDNVLCTYRFYQNGNVHFKFNCEFWKAFNVEASRLLGWIKEPADIAKEFPEELAKGAEKYFKCNNQLLLSDTSIKMLTA